MRLASKGLGLSISVWLIFTVYYALSLKYNFFTNLTDYIVYLVQMVADLCMALFSILAIIVMSQRETRNFFILLAVSILPGLISTETYNVLVHLIKIQHINSFTSELWIFPYTFFLAMQIVSWSYMLYIMRDECKMNHDNWMSLYPYIQTVMVSFLSIILIISFKDTVIKHMDVFQKLNTGLELILLNLITISLSRTKNKSLAYVEAGFLFLIAFNLAHRFSYLSWHNFKSFDIVWLSSYVVIIHGYRMAINQSGERIEFFPSNSMHVLMGALFMLFAGFLFLLFLSLGFIISSYEINDIGSLSIFPENIPSILVFSLTVSILIAKVIASYFSKPLEKILIRIDRFGESKNNRMEVDDEQFNIFEVDVLDKFIMRTVSELHESNEIKSKFLMNMSHDFRTPASGIYHLSRFVYKKINDQELKQLQKLIVDSSEKLMNLLEDVLDYSRLDSEKYGENVTCFDINSKINDIFLLALPKAKERMLDLRVTYCRQEIIYKGDAHIVNRILLNLVSNAIKFTRIGYIAIFASIEKRENIDWACIKITDTGIGIDECYHKKIFEPFTRVESPETSEFPGIGLGLSNVILMLKKIGGEVTLESRLNEGSTFGVYLPIESKMPI